MSITIQRKIAERGGYGKFGNNTNQPTPQPNIKVLIAMCCGDMVHSDFTFSLAQMYGYSLSQGITCGINIVKSSLIEVSRNIAVDQMIENDCSHILFIDSDMAFGTQALQRLLSHKVPIVGVTYSTRMPPFMLTHKNMDDTRTLEHQSDIYPVKGLGGGLLLVERRVFDSFKRPWFQMNWLDNKTIHGEDLFFCEHANNAGLEVWLDVDLSRNIRHCGQHFYSIEDTLKS